VFRYRNNIPNFAMANDVVASMTQAFVNCQTLEIAVAAVEHDADFETASMTLKNLLIMNLLPFSAAVVASWQSW
jgi:hypothetical protein